MTRAKAVTVVKYSILETTDEARVTPEGSEAAFQTGTSIPDSMRNGARFQADFPSKLLKMQYRSPARVPKCLGIVRALREAWVAFLTIRVA